MQQIECCIGLAGKKWRGGRDHRLSGNAIVIRTIGNVLSQLDLEARALIRFGEPIAQELGLSSTDIRDEADWISFMVQYPILIERPIILIGNKAIIGRPPEAVLGLIENA